MLNRKEYEIQEQERLATYAARAATSKGRVHDEPQDPYRTDFQRDRDRVVHSGAFRRLEYKTQVFVNHEGDYYRTRLTHSVEVAQISRALCRTLQLNEDLAEAIALSHDLGHTPFGHAGEEAMDELMQNFGGFEHNQQSYRVVTVLEDRYPDFTGLNLSFEVREGIIKHSGDYDIPRGVDDFKHPGYPTLEAQVVNLADEIAYTNHDLDDGLKSGMITFDGLSEVPLWNEYFATVVKDYPNAADKHLKHQTIRRLIHACIVDALEETISRINSLGISTVEDVNSRGKELTSFSETFSPRIKELKKYLFDNLYRHYRVVRMAEKAQSVIRDLFHAFEKNPQMLPAHVYVHAKHGKESLQRHICDYIAGMTDRYAFNEHSKLFDPHSKV